MRAQLTIVAAIAAAACSKTSPALMPDPGQPAPTASPEPPSTVRGTPSPTTTPTNTVPARAADVETPMGSVSYKCDNGSQVQATYGSGSVAIRWNGRIHELAADPAATERPVFKNGPYEWRLDGKDGTLLERGREVATDCEPQ